MSQDRDRTVTVLVADDDLVSVHVLEATLSKWGCQVITCSDGAQAWERLRSQYPPEIALLDWRMSGLDGLEVCRRIRQSNDRPPTYVVLLTGSTGIDDVVQCLDAGADDYVSKPYVLKELRVRLKVGERCLTQRRQLEQDTPQS